MIIYEYKFFYSNSNDESKLIYLIVNENNKKISKKIYK